MNNTLVKKLPAIKARQNFGQVLNEVAFGGNQFIVERAGKPMAAIIPVDRFWEIQGGEEFKGNSKSNFSK